LSSSWAGWGRVGKSQAGLPAGIISTMPPPDARPFTGLRDLVERATRTVSRRSTPLARVGGYGHLLAVLHELTVMVTAERDAAPAEVLRGSDHGSHRALAKELGISRQRVDQLALISAVGGHARSAPGVGRPPTPAKRRPKSRCRDRTA
jgi:hypothetical protein